MAVPPIVSKADFDAVRAHLTSRNPKWTPPRVSSGPNLLTGICFCGACGGAMTLRTGKGSAGGRYRYYACSTKARIGSTGCTGMSVPMDKLDDAVIDHLETRLLDPERLTLAPTITAESLNRFATAARCKLHDRTSGYRRDHLRALTQRVEVISKTEARIIGSRTQLLRALAPSDGGNYAAVGGVRGFEPRWRARSSAG